MKQLVCRNIISLFLLTALAGCATYSTIHSGTPKVETDEVNVQVVFSDNDLRIINDYYSRKKTKHKALPPGLAKKDTLPPGLQKQLKRNGTLPSGLATKHLPHELEERLSEIPGGYVRLKVVGGIVIIHEDTEVIVDILYEIG